MKIAIDGPAGSGKSTVAKEISKRLNIPYLNTGLVYRAFAYICMVEGLKENDVIKVFEKPIEVRLDIAKTVVIYKGEDISHKLGSEDVGKRASQIASLPGFREKINQFFRSLVGARAGGSGREGCGKPYISRSRAKGLSHRFTRGEGKEEIYTTKRGGDRGWL